MILDLPRGFGETTDMSRVLEVLADAGLPGEVTSFNQVTFVDGRVARLTNSSPFWPVVAIDEIPPRHQLVLFADADITPQLLQVAKTVRGILLVDLSRRLVWDEGRLLGGTEPRRGASRYRYAVFAAAKILARYACDVDRLMHLAELTRMQVDDSVEALASMLRPRGNGWEPKSSDALADWVHACYPGPGGVSTFWKSGLPLDVQAKRIRAFADVRLSGTWAAHQQDTGIVATSLTVFSRTGLDLDPLGFTPASTHDATVTLVIPEDRTLFGLSKFLGPAGCTDEFLTAHVIAHDPRLPQETRDNAFEAIRLRILFRIELDEDSRWNMGD